MNILLTGATGYIGSAVLTRLIDEAHSVTALVRDAEKAAVVEGSGARAVIGDLRDTELLVRLAQEAEGVIHTAATGDASAGDVDSAVADAFLAALAGSDKGYVHTGGIWSFGSNAQIAEDSPENPAEISAWRLPVQQRVLAATGVRGIVVSPAIVYGHGGGLPNLIVQAPRTHSDAAALHLIGDGSQHWASVHVDDLASLYVLAIETADAADRFIGANGANPTVRELGEAAARAAGLAGVRPESADATRQRLGAGLADALMLDQQATGTHARIELGWEPNEASLLDELATGSYTA